MHQPVRIADIDGYLVKRGDNAAVATSIHRMNKDHNNPDGVETGVTDDNVTLITAAFEQCRSALESYFASRLRCSTAEAKELAQETYLGLIRRKKRRDVHNWQGLLWCSARNRAINQLKQRRLRRERDPLVLFELPSEDHRTPETSLSQEQTAAAFERAVAALPDPWRYVVTCIRRGKSYEQIAEELHVSERTCRRYMDRAIFQIKQQIRTDDKS